MLLLLGLPRVWLFAITVGAGAQLMRQARANTQAAAERAALQAAIQRHAVAAEQLRLATDGWWCR